MQLDSFSLLKSRTHYYLCIPYLLIVQKIQSHSPHPLLKFYCSNRKLPLNIESNAAEPQPQLAEVFFPILSIDSTSSLAEVRESPFYGLQTNYDWNCLVQRHCYY